MSPSSFISVKESILPNRTYQHWVRCPPSIIFFVGLSAIGLTATLLIQFGVFQNGLKTFSFSASHFVTGHVLSLTVLGYLSVGMSLLPAMGLWGHGRKVTFSKSQMLPIEMDLDKGIDPDIK